MLNRKSHTQVSEQLRNHFETILHLKLIKTEQQQQKKAHIFADKKSRIFLSRIIVRLHKHIH